MVAINKMTNILLVKNDEVDGMKIKRAFKKNNRSTLLWQTMD